VGNAKIRFIFCIHFFVLIQRNDLIKFQISRSYMYIIRATWIYSYFLAEEKFIKHVIMDHIQIQSEVDCSWHRCNFFTYLTCVLHLKALITQSSTLTKSLHLNTVTIMSACKFDTLLNANAVSLVHMLLIAYMFDFH
jgi:hypothetical protein